MNLLSAAFCERLRTSPAAPSRPSTLLCPAQHRHHRVPAMSADEERRKIVSMVARYTAVYPLGSMGIAPAKVL
jgi:hypothetical protein